jgi:transposase
MSENSISTTWVGLDVHQNSITAAILQPGATRPTIQQLSGDLNATRRLFRRLASAGPVRACYEASGAGFVLQRALTRDGFHCEIIAPSLIPRKPGDRRKTDRLDALRLLDLYRHGQLTPVAVPDEEQEAVRQLVRSRLSLIRHGTRLKHRIVRVLATHGHRFTGSKSNWTQTHRTWLTDLRQELTGPLRMVLGLHLDHLEYIECQIRALDAEMARLAQQPGLRDQVEALCCFRGIQTLTAMTLLTEIGDIRRFAHPRQLMAYCGLIPSERSSGDVQRRGPITKSGNAHLRRVLVESAWHYRHRTGAQLRLTRQRQGQPAAVVAAAVKAQHRLSRRFWHLAQTKHVNKAVTAVARELCGFLWAALMALETTR